MPKPITPFEAQQQRIGTFARMREAIDEKQRLEQKEKSTTSLIQQAKTTEKANVTNETFIDFINDAESILLNILGKNRNPVDPVLRRERDEKLGRLRTQVVPQWNSQFKRLFNRSLREGKISIDRLEFYKNKYLEVTSEVNNQEQFEEAETATHTSAFRLDRPTNKTPKGTTINMINQQISNDDVIITDPSLPPEIELLDIMLKRLNKPHQYYKNIKNEQMKSEIEDLIREIKDYKAQLSTSKQAQDSATDFNLGDRTNQQVDIYNEIVGEITENQKIISGLIQIADREQARITKIRGDNNFLGTTPANIRGLETFTRFLKGPVEGVRAEYKKLQSDMEATRRYAYNVNWMVNTGDENAGDEIIKLENMIEEIQQRIVKFEDNVNNVVALIEENASLEGVFGSGKSKVVKSIHPYSVQVLNNEKERRSRRGKIINPLGVKSRRPDKKNKRLGGSTQKKAPKREKDDKTNSRYNVIKF